MAFGWRQDCRRGLNIETTGAAPSDNRSVNRIGHDPLQPAVSAWMSVHSAGRLCDRAMTVCPMAIQRTRLSLARFRVAACRPLDNAILHASSG
jgi:hypothetical protein